jgi:hypothetical protein
MRACSSGGGVTNSGATFRLRVENVLEPTVSESFAVSVEPSARRASAATAAGPGLAARSIPTSACQVLADAPWYAVNGWPKAEPLTAVSAPAVTVSVSRTASPGASTRSW